MTPVSHRIDRVDPLDLDLDLADALADVFTASERGGRRSPSRPKTGPDLLTSRRWAPTPGRWTRCSSPGTATGSSARPPSTCPGGTTPTAPRSAVRVHPDARGPGLGRDLWQRAVDFAREQGRTRVQHRRLAGRTPASTVLDHWGLARTGVGVIRRIDVHAHPAQHLGPPVRRGARRRRRLRAGPAGRRHPGRPGGGAGRPARRDQRRPVLRPRRRAGRLGRRSGSRTTRARWPAAGRRSTG